MTINNELLVPEKKLYYNPIEQPTKIVKGPGSIILVFPIFTIFLFIFILYNSHQRVKLENINLAVEHIDKQKEELNKLKANLMETNDRK